jgi:sugar phosphate isomerase/epimerase
VRARVEERRLTWSWQPELVLCNVSVAGASFPEHVTAARQAGFDAISLLGRAHRRATQRDGLSDTEMRTLLDDNGLALTDVEAVGDWLGPSPDDQPKFLHHVYPTETYLDVAAALGARNVVAVHFGHPAPLDTAAERFAQLCDRAAERGLNVALEFPAFATIADVATAWGVVRVADRPNGGLLVDTWHHRRGGNDDQALEAVDGSRVLSVQLADAAGDPVGPLVEDVMHRCLPGDGDFGVVDLIRRLDGLGVRAPIGIEVFDEALLAQGTDVAARRLGESLRAVVGEALT